jgi:galactonate dehydratase
MVGFPRGEIRGMLDPLEGGALYRKASGRWPKVKITRIDDLHADFGWRTISFLRVETADGILGWSEYYEGAGNRGLTAVLRELAEEVVGRDARQLNAVVQFLTARTIQAGGGINHQAIAAIGNALLDVQAKALGVPVHALFGGAIRSRLPLYWSHCASYRARYSGQLGVRAPASYDDIAAIGSEVRERGFRALKTNTLLLEEGRFVGYRPTAGESAGFPELNLAPAFTRATRRQLEALREGAGPDVAISLDVNYYFKPEGFLQLARGLEDLELSWLEMDNFDPQALARIRMGSRIPVASCEHEYGARGYKSFLDAGALDVAIVDPIWNGFLDALKIAQLADMHEVNVAPHNYYGYLSDFISAQFAAPIPNFRIMEHDIDGVPWRAEFYTHAPEISDGQMNLPTRPGWGTDIDEAAVRARPPKDR